MRIHANLECYAFSILLGYGKVEFDVANTLYDGETANGSCMFTGETKPVYVRISGMGPNCTVDGEVAIGPALHHAKYTNNFEITCFRSGISFDLKCNANNENDMTSKRIQGMHEI